MIEEKFYTCKYDRPFKEIMLNEENKDILQALLENLLKVKISNIEIKPSERNTKNIKIKRKMFDALLYTSEGKIEIEVNSNIEEYVKPRNMSYISDVYAHHTLIGETYDEETMIIQINLTYGISKTGDNEPVREYEMQDKSGKLFVKNLKIFEFNMDYYKKIWENNNKKLINENKFIIMLDLDLPDLKKLSKMSGMVNRYMEKLENINKSPEFREYMSKEEDERKIRNTREKVFERKEKELESKEKEINNKEKEVNNKEQEINNKEQEINSKEQEINSKEQEISNKQQEITIKEKLVIDKQKQLNKKEEELSNRQNMLIKNMLMNGIDIDTICKITGLSKNDIENIES